MAIPKVRAADDIGLECTLFRGLAAVYIDPSATVRVAVVNTRRTKIYTTPVTLNLADTNHDLPNGVLWVVIPSSNTGGMVPGDGVLEIEVNDATQKLGNRIATWGTPVKVVKTNIS